MKQVLFGIFAHPDDEGFGPSGTLYKLAHSGVDVHLICATAGQNGMNPDKAADLGKLRLKEWGESGRLIGATSQHYLGYTDGTLNNSVFHKLATEIASYISGVLQGYKEPVELSFMTFDNTGLSGHIDHIVMSMVASYVYQELKASPPAGATIKDLMYFCICQADNPEPNISYVYMPAGRPEDQIDIVNDISDVAKQKLAIMRAHHSQRQDAKMLLQRDTMLKREHFYLAK